MNFGRFTILMNTITTVGTIARSLVYAGLYRMPSTSNITRTAIRKRSQRSDGVAIGLKQLNASFLLTLSLLKDANFFH